MNRLQKKCLLATAGLHALLLVTLLVGPGFFAPKPKADDARVLDVIPANLIDAAFNSGVRNATAPAPIPPAPAPAPAPVAPPPPTLAERFKNFFEPAPPKAIKSAPEKAASEPHKIEVNTQLVARAAPKNSTPASPPRDARAVNSAIKSLRKNLSSPTEVNLPGNSSVAYANFGSVVTSVYHQKWLTLAPTGMEKENAVVTFRVTIASDGTVLSASIITPSGDANVDRGVQRMLDSVNFIAPFPEGATEKERTYTIDFNAIRTTE
jgi:TonB family protein